MNKNLFIFIVSILISVTAASCQRARNKADYARLVRLDSLIEVNPRAGVDSLQSIVPTNLSVFNQGYYTLLDVISKDKTYYPFRNDSLIKQAVSVLAKHKYLRPELYARSLMYHGLVLYRMEVIDTTAYQPLKEALARFEKTNTDYGKQYSYLGNFYLGEIHDKNDNYDEAYSYLRKALLYANALKRDDYIYFTYRELAWNRLKVEDVAQAKIYIDSLTIYNQLIKKHEKSFNNLLAVYYFYNKEYQKSLELELKLTVQIPIEDTLDDYKRNYRLATTYYELGEYNNAYLYIRRAIAQSDSTNPLNYIIYTDLGKISTQMGKPYEAAEAYSKAYELLHKATEKQQNKQILELEKKYDYSEAEIKKLLAEKRLYYITIGAGFLVLMLLIMLLFNLKRASRKQHELLVADNERIKLEMTNERLQHENRRKEWSARLLLFIAAQQEAVDDVLYKISINKEITNNKKLSDTIEDVQKNYQKERKRVMSALTEDEVFYQICGLNEQQAAHFNENEKMLLALLACGFNKEKIALMLSSTPESVRVRTVKLRSKISSLRIETDKIEL